MGGMIRVLRFPKIDMLLPQYRLASDLDSQGHCAVDTSEALLCCLDGHEGERLCSRPFAWVDSTTLVSTAEGAPMVE